MLYRAGTQIAELRERYPYLFGTVRGGFGGVRLGAEQPAAANASNTATISAIDLIFYRPRIYFPIFSITRADAFCNVILLSNKWESGE